MLKEMVHEREKDERHHKANAKEIKNYLIWGIISYFLNVGIYYSLVYYGIDYRISNIFTLVFIRIFCFFTNKFLVFKTKTGNFLLFMKEFISFIIARTITFVLDFMGVILLVEVFQINKYLVKAIVSVAVIILNYLLSKKMVFKEVKNETDNTDSMLQ